MSKTSKQKNSLNNYEQLMREFREMLTDELTNSDISVKEKKSDDSTQSTMFPYGGERREFVNMD